MIPNLWNRHMLVYTVYISAAICLVKYLMAGCRHFIYTWSRAHIECVEFNEIVVGHI
jgi:hypothetical protein